MGLHWPIQTCWVTEILAVCFEFCCQQRKCFSSLKEDVVWHAYRKIRRKSAPFKWCIGTEKTFPWARKLTGDVAVEQCSFSVQKKKNEMYSLIINLNSSDLSNSDNHLFPSINLQLFVRSVTPASWRYQKIPCRIHWINTGAILFWQDTQFVWKVASRQKVRKNYLIL